jgi:hypothetical protein
MPNDVVVTAVRLEAVEVIGPGAEARVIRPSVPVGVRAVTTIEPETILFS